jgi:hypothetical protein
MKQVVIMPGGFHPFHAGHAALYQSAKKAFPGADVYVAATNDTSQRPFPFAVKEKLAQLAGVPRGRFMQVKSPFGAEEILAPYNPDDTQLIFVKSEKNSKTGPSPEGPFPAEPDPKTGQLPLVTRGARKGLPVSDRLQYYRPGQPMAPMSRHSYLAYLPTVEFGPGITSGSEIRNIWPKFTEQLKTDLVMSLYPKTQNNPKLAANVVKMLDIAIGTELEESTGDRPHDPAPGREFVFNKYFVKITPTAIEIYNGGDLVLSKPGDFSNPTRQDMYNARRYTTDLFNKQLKKKQLARIAGKSVDENQGWAATYEADGITAGTGVTGGMHASYQDRYNQPIDERDITSKLGTKRDIGKSVRKWRKERGLDEQDYLEENKVDPIESATVDFYQNQVGDVDKKPVDNYREIARELLGKTENPSMRKKIMDILVQGNKNPYIQGGIITTVAAIVSGGILHSAARMGLTPQQTNMMLQAILNTVVPTVVSRLNGKSWSDTAKYTLASAGIGTGIAAMTESGRKK